MAIKEDIKRKEAEGEQDNPFTRQKCRPRMVTKKEIVRSCQGNPF